VRLAPPSKTKSAMFNMKHRTLSIIN